MVSVKLYNFFEGAKSVQMNGNDKARLREFFLCYTRTYPQNFRPSVKFLSAFPVEVRAFQEISQLLTVLRELRDATVQSVVAHAKIIGAKIQLGIESIDTLALKLEEKECICLRAGIHSHLEALLKAYGKILENRFPDQAICSILEKGANHEQQLRIENERKAIAKNNREQLKFVIPGRFRIAKNEIVALRDDFQQARSSSNSHGSLTFSQNLLKEAEQLLGAAAVNLRGQSYGKAFVLLQKAHRSADQGRLFLWSDLHNQLAQNPVS
ncbi:MAG: hypothetical protein HYW95_01315 [Candidatus Wildermuthbacteria bacterium]|nr:hypothetical protein [Candidatus Wildermuthbacteria bacterium]